MSITRFPLCALLLAMILAACQQAAEPETELATGVPAAQTWDEFVDRYIEEHAAAHPAWAVVQGRHEFDGQLPDWSRAGIEAEIARLHASRDAAMAFATDDLTGNQRYQREYLVSRLDHDLFWAEKARWPFRNPQFYVGWMNDSLDPSPYLTLDYAPAVERMAAYIRYLGEIPRVAGQIRENLEMPMPRTWLNLGADSFGGLAVYFRDEVPAIWAGVDDDELQLAFGEANAGAVAALEELVAWLESHRATATEEYALGPDLFRQMLWDTERVDITLEELEAIGRADMARNLTALQEACAELAPGEDIRDCFARMADRKPRDGSVLAARDQLEETRAFVVEQDLVTIPGDEVALVEEAPPYARSNFAYISIPGPWEKNQPSTYYISPPNPAWPEEVQAAYVAGEADLLFTSVHEVWPGHFLNFLHANRSEWIFGRAFVGYAFGEGWAHYTEEMMLEAGLRDGDPETRIGQLSNALLRNARFLSTIGLHTQGWSVEDSKRFFMEEAYQSEGTAIQQAARGTYDPAYLNYMMGKLLIRKLREDWTATRGGRSAWREFHDTFLSFGGPPIPLVRQQMMGEPEPVAVFPDYGTAATATRWDVHASMGMDALVLIGALTGDKLQASYYAPEVEFITGRMSPEALASLENIAGIAAETQSLVGPFLALVFSAGPARTLDDVIASARDPERLLRPGLEASQYWKPDRWENVRDRTMPEVLKVLLALREIGFESYWHERVEPRVMPAVEGMKAHLGGYDIIPEQQRLLGRKLAPDIELVVLNFSLPYGIKIVGQRFLAHHSYDKNVQLRIAAHEIFHPPFDVNDEALLDSLEPLRSDPWMISIVEDHDPAFGYNSFVGVLNEDSAQALDQLVAERLGFARDPARRWRHADDGMHMLAAAIYHMLREDGYANTGGVYAKWLERAIALGRFEPSEVKRRATEVVGAEAVDRWHSADPGP